ncbi:MAG TPA: DoxX family protein [Candidatus Limnocylindria bacterium]|nr:DoxX family protein [Candidatus Limnocylindria bacterium]
MVNDLGQFATRIAIGLGIASHGTQKAFGWFDGPGPEGWAQFTESLGLKPGTTYGTIGAANELTAGALIALGLGGPLGPAILIAQMLVAAETVHRKNGFFVQQGGLEIPMLYAAAALGLASTGYGALSLDRAFGLHDKLRHPILTTLALGGAIAGACTVLAQRELPVTSEAPPGSGLET